MAKKITTIVAKTLLEYEKITLINNTQNTLTLRFKGKNHVIKSGETIDVDGLTHEMKRLMRDGILEVHEDNK